MLIYLQAIDSPEDRTRFEALYTAYRGLMFHVANRILQNPQDAEDAVQMAFLSLAGCRLPAELGPQARHLAATVAANKPADMDALMECKYNGTDLTVTQQQQEMVLVIGENIKVRRFARFSDGVSVPYIHAGGKIGVLVNLEVTGDIDATEVGKDMAMQIAALNPRFLDKSQVTQEVLDEEKKILLAQMANDPKMANKPDQVKEKIVMGKLNKFYAENCLLQQTFVKDNEVTVEQYKDAVAKKLGGSIVLKDAVRFEKGEGIEKKQENFAEEIAKLAK